MSGEDPYVSRRAVLRSWPKGGVPPGTTAIERAVARGDFDLARKLIDMRERATQHATSQDTANTQPESQE